MHAEAIEQLRTLTRGLEAEDRQELEALLPEMYGALRAMARRHLSLERPGHTLSATALVHEAYIKLDSFLDSKPESRNRFMGLSARMMRQVLVDHARARNREKRGGGLKLATYTESVEAPGSAEHDLLTIDQLLDQLEQQNPRHCRIVECRYFAGMSIPETAQALDISEPTVKRGWRLARAWLKDALQHGTNPE